MLARVVALPTALSLTAASAHAQISDGVVKIGVLNDESGPYATLAGPGSMVAALMAVEGWGGSRAQEERSRSAAGWGPIPGGGLVGRNPAGMAAE